MTAIVADSMSLPDSTGNPAWGGLWLRDRRVRALVARSAAK